MLHQFITKLIRIYGRQSLDLDYYTHLNQDKIKQLFLNSKQLVSTIDSRIKAQFNIFAYLGAWADISPDRNHYVFKPHVKCATLANIIKRYIRVENSNDLVTEKLGRLDFRYNIEKDRRLMR